MTGDLDTGRNEPVVSVHTDTRLVSCRTNADRLGPSSTRVAVLLQCLETANGREVALTALTYSA